MLDVITQLSKKYAESSLDRRFDTNKRVLCYRRIDSAFYLDTFFSNKVINKHGFTIMQLFVSDNIVFKVYDMKSLSQSPDALKIFYKKVGALKSIIVDKRARLFVNFSTRLG